MKALTKILIGRSVRLPSEENKPCKPVEPQHRVPFPPLGSVSKHGTAATMILMVNTANQVNRTDIYLCYFVTPRLIHASDCLQGPFIKLQPEQTVVQIRHNNLPMLFM